MIAKAPKMIPQPTPNNAPQRHQKWLQPTININVPRLRKGPNASSAFVDPRVMPDWLRSFADINPITFVSDSVRSLALGPELSAQFGLELGPSLLGAALWMAGIVLVFGYLSVRVYRRAA